MKNIAVILAGGKGNRLNSDIPKQFIKVAGKKIIEHTIEIFEKHTLIDEICIVCNSAYIYLMEDILIKNKYIKVKKIINGGAERYESSLAAIKAYQDKDEKKMIFHDAVRPLLSSSIITKCIESLDVCDAVDVAVKTTDTIISLDENNKIDFIPDRNYLYNGQTPQGFKLSVIKKAYELALQDKNFKTTDDCGVVKKYLPEIPIHVVQGHLDNIKVTYPEDVFLLDKLFQLKTIQGDSFLTASCENFKDSVNVIFGGSYGIGKAIYDLLKEQDIKVYEYSRSSTNTNINNVDQVRAALDNVYQHEGRIDNVIVTAGILIKQPLACMNYDEILNSINTNYFGNVIVAKESFKYLKKTSGSLLLFTSSSYTRGRSLYSLYSSSKAAIVNFVQAISEEWSCDNIRINCINPERTRTPMRVKNFGVEDECTLLKPEKVADCAVEVIKSGLTGEVIDVRH
ncbi:MAG: 2-C-methyl-D-erythritol 4-phosphate cytidylyltransferase [Treponema sp.]